MIYLHPKHTLDESGNNQLVVIRSPSGDIDVIVIAIVHHPTKRVIINNGNGESTRMVVCEQNIDNEQRSALIVQVELSAVKIQVISLNNVDDFLPRDNTIFV